MFFINTTALSSMGESILTNNYGPHSIGQNLIWRRGAEDFASEFCDDIYPCLSCGAYAVTLAEFIRLDGSNSEDDLICLCCLSSINTTYQGKIIDCYHCCDKAYYIEIMNEQPHQLYSGKCVECETDTFVRKCHWCHHYYHPSNEREIRLEDKYYCSQSCAD